MARRRKSRRARHSNPPARRARRSSRRISRRMSRRRYHRNAPSQALVMELATVVAMAGIGYVIAKKGGDLAKRYLPAMVPQKDVVGALLISGGVILAADKLLKGKPDIRKALIAGAAVPTFEAIAQATGLGSKLGLSPTIMIPAPAAPGGALPAPVLSAALEAQLSAALEDGYSPDY